MNNLLFLIVILFITTTLYSNDGAYIFNKPRQGFSKIMSFAKRNYLITSHEIFEIDKKDLKQKIAFPFTCNDASVFLNGFALATDSGIAIYSASDNSIKKYLPGKINKKS